MKKIISILFVVAFLGLTSCNFDSSNITDVKMCTALNDNQCDMDKPVFDAYTPTIYVSAHLNNAPTDTQVSFGWFYLGDDRILIDTVTLSSGDNIGTLNLQSGLSKPTNGWPAGDYEVVITIIGTEKEPIVKQFWVQ